MIGVVTWMVAVVLLMLSGIHLYWLLGGQKGHEAVIPTSGAGADPLFQPSKFATGFVMILLAVAAWFVLELGGVIEVLFPDLLITYGGWLLSAMFILRAIGDFRWLGLFKSRKGSVFARWDSLLYSRLCLLLGAAILFLEKAKVFV